MSEVNALTQANLSMEERITLMLNKFASDLDSRIDKKFEEFKKGSGFNTQEDHFWSAGEAPVLERKGGKVNRKRKNVDSEGLRCKKAKAAYQDSGILRKRAKQAGVEDTHGDLERGHGSKRHTTVICDESSGSAEIELSCSSDFDSDVEMVDTDKDKNIESKTKERHEENAGVIDPFGESMFDPMMIKHPLSPEWSPAPHVAEYVQMWLRKQIPKDVRLRLRSECPRPSLANKIALTPELDAKIIAFVAKGGRDPKKGLDKGLKMCQDRLLDLTGPLTKIFDMAEEAYVDKKDLDIEELREWIQRAVCLLSNANTEISVERRKSILLKIDPKLVELANNEGGSDANGSFLEKLLLKR
ncbi:uncharacterized protein LOC144781653 [Lissotriton helveticus]